MTAIKINEQIAFFRKQKGLTQEELASALGVTNQSVSKWESAQCCPDIQLLPTIAKLFDVSIDELFGYNADNSLSEICLKIKKYFSSLPEREAFEGAYRIAALLHEAAVTDGYKQTMPWEEKDYSAENTLSWGMSVCSEPEGSTARKSSGIFFSLAHGYATPSSSQLRNLTLALEPLTDMYVLKAMYSLYGLTVGDFDLFVPIDRIAASAHISDKEAEAALKKLPVTVKEENGKLLYRLEGSFCHIPPLLSFLQM